MQTEESFGIIPLKKLGSDWQVFIVQHNAGHWAFPKGHAIGAEPPQTTAKRELEEETGLRLVTFLHFPPLQEQYTYESKDHGIIEKTVTYYLAEVIGNPVLQKEEISDGKWIGVNHIHEYLTFTEAQVLAKKVFHLLA